MAKRDAEDNILEFFKTVFSTYDTNKDGTIDAEELSKVLSALGRMAPKDKVEDLVKRFDVDLSGRIEFGNGEFLGVIATIAVTSIQDIDDFVFSAAFRTFDHDADGLITPLEMHIVTSLFLPMDTEAEDQFVEEMIQKMDTNVDGKIDYKEFVQFVRKCGTADILSTQTSSSSDGASS